MGSLLLLAFQRARYKGQVDGAEAAGIRGAGPESVLRPFPSLDFWARLRVLWLKRRNVGSPLCLLSCLLSLSECCGALEYYDKAFDRVTTRSEKPLRSIKRIFHTVTTTDDPVIRKVRWPCWPSPAH